MTEQTWKIEKNLCRCCHSEGAFTNLAEPCFNLGEEERYSQMLLESLDVNVAPVTGPLCEVTYTICESCIARLRDACNFKRQVVQCEKQFHDLYNKNVIRFDSCYDIKVEAPESEDEDDLKTDVHLDDFALHSDDDDKKLATDDLLRPKRRLPTKRKPKAKSKTNLRKKLRTVKSEAEATKTEAEAETEAQADDTTKQGKEKKGSKFRIEESDYTRDGDVFQCAHCDKRYDKLFSLKFHVKTKHYKIARFSCPYCTEEFMTPAPLTIHKLNVHNKDERFKCNACKGTFNTKVQLRKHINNFHMMGERYKCEWCEYESFSFEGMYKHKFKHKTVKDYHCRFCRKAFLRKATLDLHERIHTGDRRKVCTVCGKAFVQKASLNYHMTKYHPEVNF